MILFYYLYLNILFLFVKNAQSVPFQPLLSTIVRRNHPGDLLFPTVCQPLCQDLFHAVDNPSNGSAPCTCSCPPEAPVYLNTAGACVARIDECHEHIRFSPSELLGNISLPVIILPSHNGIILPKNSILWKESGITVTPNGSVNCIIRSVYFDNIHHRWKNHKTSLFRLSLIAYHTVLVFVGSDLDSASLLGSVVQMKLQCDDYNIEHCLAFRVNGISGVNPSSLSHMRGSDLTKLIIIVIAFLLSFIATFIVWRFCWKRKKRRLISDYQMKYLYQLRQQQHMQKIENELRREYSVEEGDLQIERPPTNNNNNKARLFFSAEYLETELMHNPPQMALQFLFDLRRMVDLAKDRIRNRRFIPNLNIIIEEDNRNVIEEQQDEAPSPIPSDLSTLPVPSESPLPTSPLYNSPRSIKSIDSGRESKEDEDSSDNEIERKNITTNINVKNIVNGFESRTNNTTFSSQLPVLKKPSVVPRTQVRPASQIPTLMGQASPRPQPRQLTVKEEENNNNNKGGKNSYRTRKGYSVFPADPMLHKSLPRRKKSIPVPIARQSLQIENNT